MNIYYIYSLVDPKDGKIFYIGKGKEKRAWIHFLPYKLKIDNHKNRKIKKIISEGNFPIVELLYENLDEESAYTYEKILIEEIGLKNLTNCTPGGKGARLNKNFSGKKHTEQSKKIISEKQLGSNNSMAGNKWKRSENGKKSFAKKMIEARSGHTVSEETREKISNSLINKPSIRKRYILINNDIKILSLKDKINQYIGCRHKDIEKYIKIGFYCNWQILYDYPYNVGL